MAIPIIIFLQNNNLRSEDYQPVLAELWREYWFMAPFSAIILGIIFLIFVRWREHNIKEIENEKLKIERLNAQHYKSEYEIEQIINYFSFSLIDKHNVEDVIWDVCKNLISKLGFVDCIIYLWNDEKTKMVQKASYGIKNSEEDIINNYLDVEPGQGIVGQVINSKLPILVTDTSIDSRYRPDEMVRLSEISVPILYDSRLLGVIDSEHPEKNFFTLQHMKLLTTISTLMSHKIISLEAQQLVRQSQIKVHKINEQLSKAKLDSLRSQMNPHFIFNSLNAIQECILTNKVDEAYEYLSKFSKLQRMVLNNSEKELISLSNEIEMLRLYLSLESLRFSKSFAYEINTDSISDIDDIVIPSLLTQPLVENAIWHGLRSKEGEKMLKIKYEETTEHLMVTIEDNGIGREKAIEIKNQKLNTEKFASKGTTILKNRLEVLSQQIKTEIVLEFIDKKDAAGKGIGTIVKMIFPINLEL